MKTISKGCALTALGLLLSSCEMPQRTEVPDPSAVMDFALLFRGNCAGCHGESGRGGAAIRLADPVYLAIADDSAIRKAIVNGVPGTAMPAFDENAGGMLKAKQVDAIVQGMRTQWSRPGTLEGANPPPYAASSTGDSQRGETVYKSFCDSCHGPNGRGGPHGSSIVNYTYLALVSDQGLRTVVIAGRPELNAPDWRGNAPGRPMSDQDVTDVVAWLISQRVQASGQPYPPAIRH